MQDVLHHLWSHQTHVFYARWFQTIPLPYHLSVPWRTMLCTMKKWLLWQFASCSVFCIFNIHGPCTWILSYVFFCFLYLQHTAQLVGLANRHAGRADQPAMQCDICRWCNSVIIFDKESFTKEGSIPCVVHMFEKILSAASYHFPCKNTLIEYYTY